MLYVGIQEGVPIVTIALSVASVSRVVVYRSNVDLTVVGLFSLGALPTTVLGTLWFTVAPPAMLTRLFGAVLIAAVLWRRLQPSPPEHFRKGWFVPLGAAYGVLAGVSTALASMPAPFFLAHGLRKEAYVGTMGWSVFLGQIVKLVIFGHTNVLAAPVLKTGLILGPFVIAGTVIGKRILSRVSESAFVTIIDVFMIASGVLFLVRG